MENKKNIMWLGFLTLFSTSIILSSDYSMSTTSTTSRSTRSTRSTASTASQEFSRERGMTAHANDLKGELNRANQKLQSVQATAQTKEMVAKQELLTLQQDTYRAQIAAEQDTYRAQIAAEQKINQAQIAADQRVAAADQRVAAAEQRNVLTERCTTMVATVLFPVFMNLLDRNS